MIKPLLTTLLLSFALTSLAEEEFAVPEVYQPHDATMATSSEIDHGLMKGLIALPRFFDS